MIGNDVFELEIGLAFFSRHLNQPSIIKSKGRVWVIHVGDVLLIVLYCQEVLVILLLLLDFRVELAGIFLRVEFLLLHKDWSLKEIKSLRWRLVKFLFHILLFLVCLNHFGEVGGLRHSIRDIQWFTWEDDVVNWRDVTTQVNLWARMSVLLTTRVFMNLNIFLCLAGVNLKCLQRPTWLRYFMIHVLGNI